ncbi:AB hydrolase superfamily protein C1039.03-like [Haliotis rubra]|uniref:AB hydrolase superfamily protein C1039.03-like n=1 Tax=Haliotis rubra TaxID=36100 RepID=UPI001EE5801F|nr:AB hydrolase superfamily protein C1039.03-like [Haliotis rubra]
MPEGIEEIASKYKLHSESLSFLEGQQAGGVNIIDDSIPLEDRRRKSAVLKDQAEEFAGSVKEFRVPSAALPDGIPIDVIKPRSCNSNPIILVYFHGGGLVFGSKEADRPICQVLARDLPCVVVNVEYRLAPENKFPAAFEDGKNVLRWVLMNKALIGGTNESKIGLVGCSAGGTIAATLCHEVTKGIAFQVLVYPWLDLTCDQPSCTEFENGPILTVGILRWCVDKVVNNPEEEKNPRASPLFRESFTCLPPTLLLLAEFDPLRDQAYNYKRKIKDAGIDAESLMIKGSLHGFFDKPDHYKDLGLKAREKMFAFIKKRVASS